MARSAHERRMSWRSTADRKTTEAKEVKAAKKLVSKIVSESFSERFDKEEARRIIEILTKYGFTRNKERELKKDMTVVLERGDVEIEIVKSVRSFKPEDAENYVGGVYVSQISIYREATKGQ